MKLVRDLKLGGQEMRLRAGLILSIENELECSPELRGQFGFTGNIRN